MQKALLIAVLALMAPTLASAQTPAFDPTSQTPYGGPPSAQIKLSVVTPPIEATASLAAVNDRVAVSAAGLNTAVVRLAPGSWTGTVVVEGTADGVAYDLPLNVLPYGGGPSQVSITAGGTYEITITGLAGFRVRASTAITGGPVVALARAASGNKSIRVGAPSGNPVPVTLVPIRTTPIDRSGAITLGGQAQTFAVANATRNGLCVTNLSSGDEWLNEVAKAAVGQSSRWIPSGAEYCFPTSGMPIGDVSIYGATTGQIFTGREW